MKKAVIFGTGLMGETAYRYYVQKYDIAYFVDNNEKKWNTYFHNIPIYHPKILKDKKDIMVVVPNGKYKDEMCKQLYDYGIKEVLIFELSEKIYTLYNKDDIKGAEKEIIVSFQGGLGNQLFQYAFMRYITLSGKKGRADLSRYIYPHVMKFVLEDIFDEIYFERCNPYVREDYINNEEIYNEIILPDTTGEEFFNQNIKDIDYGYIDGFFQSSFFVESIRKYLLSELKFPKVEDFGMQKYLKKIVNENAVAIHIRRGDYMIEGNQKLFGGICTKNYYLQAIEIMKKNIENPLFIFFSDDISYVKENYIIEEAIYVDSKEFECYKDWYDMYLMSKCKHNIIANSTFSWWGAWLNTNSEKIVIAPSKWLNVETYTDICPKEWIRIYGG